MFKPISFYIYGDNMGNILLVVYSIDLLHFGVDMVKYQPIVSSLTIDLYLS